MAGNGLRNYQRLKPTTMTQKEMMNATFFKGVMRSALNELKQYAREYNSGICEGIAHRMEHAFKEYKF